MVVLSHGLAAALAKTDSVPATSPTTLVGHAVQLQDHPYRVIGVLAAEKGTEDRLAAITPFTVAAAISLIVGDIGVRKQETGGSGQEAAKRVEPRLRAPICDLQGATAYRLRTSYM
jgi:hypothetical protein